MCRTSLFCHWHVQTHVRESSIGFPSPKAVQSEEVQPIIAVLTNAVKCCFDVFGFDLGVS
jgi:hypothetical protein